MNNCVTHRRDCFYSRTNVFYTSASDAERLGRLKIVFSAGNDAGLSPVCCIKTI